MRIENKQQNGRLKPNPIDNHIKYIWSTLFPEYIKYSYHSTIKRQITQLKNRQGILRDIFSREDRQMASKPMKKFSTLLAFRKMESKATMKYPFTCSKMTIIKKTENDKCQKGCGEIRTLNNCWQEYKTMHTFGK